jgi:dienelactone hydrolase
MPLNMAVFNPNIAGKIIENYPIINHWVIAGHSVGGTMAAQYTDNHQDVIDGLMIWASYPAGNADLSGSDIPVVSIYGSLDPRVNEFSVADREDLLPDTTHYIQIKGGDHHQFGSYETEPEDDHATISRASQHEQIIAATVEILQLIAKIE